ncbi:hypothetical protein STRAU_1594 [Streptomyces aurantiacus JA 4570]|uniref:Secreted protein/lipoprotein n=1 Tax=Streptomyces aurantiacus JA 4570 TaxID=1286094 RepID=S3ZR84_9ACTN|nr:hypothetical protein STRAU_1594 [Streptomyces aurantiacus JA 4570]
MAAVGVLAALGSLTACSDSDGGESPEKPRATATSSKPAASPSPSDASDGAKGELLAAYRSYWNEKTTAYAKGSMSGTKLKTYAKGNALGMAQADLVRLKSAGQIIKGKPDLAPKVSRLDLGKKVPFAQITDCVDVAEWKPIDRKTREEIVLPKERRIKYVSRVTAERWDKQWVILEVKPEDKAC